MSSAAARRFDAPPTRSFSAASPVAPSPQARKRSYADAGTQYSPDGLPPTARPHAEPEPAPARAPAPAPAPAIAQTPRGDSSAAPAATEPPEPQLRLDPQPVTPAQRAQQQTCRTPKENVHSPDQPPEQPAAQREPSTVLQIPASPAKRARPDDQNEKVMPLQYETCDVKDLGVLISDMLMELVRLNDGFPLRDGTLTRFHSR